MPTIEVLRTELSWIQKSTNVCGGEACIRNTRIPVWSVLAVWQQGLSEDELVDYFVTPLTFADVQAALAYGDLHHEEITRAIEENEK